VSSVVQATLGLLAIECVAARTQSHLGKLVGSRVANLIYSCKRFACKGSYKC
jgi:hypothetical protein